MGFDGWVFNPADLETAKVIWAHDLGPGENQRLIDYFRGRKVWLVDGDSNPPKLIPYKEVARDETIVEREIGR